MGWGALAGAIGAAGLSAGGAALSYKEQKKLLEKQQAFEREKALHAHQWEVSDLKAAGLNPVLSAGGSGAAMGSPSAPSTAAPDLGAPITAAAQRSLEKKKLEAEKAGIDAAIKQAEALAKQAEENARKAKAEADLIERNIRASAGQVKAEQEYNDSKIGQTLHKIGQGAKDAGAIIQPISNVVGGAMIYRGLRGVKQAMSAGAALNAQRNFQNWNTPNVFKPRKDSILKYNKPNKTDYIHLSPNERGFMKY